MKVITFIWTSLAVLGMPNLALAQDSGVYGSIGVTSYEFDTIGTNAKLGYNFNEYFGVEGEGVLGLTSKSETFGTSEIKAKVDYTIGAFGVVRLPLNSQIELFARGGYHQTGVTLKTSTTETSGDIDGLALGGGVQYNFSEISGIRAEYTYFDGKFSSFDTASISFVRKF